MLDHGIPQGGLFFLELASEPPPSLLGGVDQCVEILLEDGR